MLKYEDFPKKCIKCKKSDLPLEKFQIGYIKREFITGNAFSRFSTSRSYGYSVKFPVCRKCKIQFKRHIFAKQLLIIMIGIDFGVLLISFLSIKVLIPAISFPFDIFNVPFIISIIITVVFGLLVKIYPHKTKNYIIATENRVNFKDANYEKEVYENKTLRMVEDDLELNMIQCPKCGSLITKDTNFCLSCGKDLRSY